MFSALPNLSLLVRRLQSHPGGFDEPSSPDSKFVEATSAQRACGEESKGILKKEHIDVYLREILVGNALRWIARVEDATSDRSLFLEAYYTYRPWDRAVKGDGC